MPGAYALWTLGASAVRCCITQPARADKDCVRDFVGRASVNVALRNTRRSGTERLNGQGDAAPVCACGRRARGELPDVPAT
jgi:hypothetical protein